MRGKLIVIEGTDCSGKETQAKLLAEKLKQMNIKVKHLSFFKKSAFCYYITNKYFCQEKLLNK